MKIPIFNRPMLQEVIIAIVGYGIGIGITFLDETKSVFNALVLGTLISIFLSLVFRNPLIPDMFKSMVHGGNKLDDISKKITDLVSDHKFTKVNNHINELGQINRQVGLRIFNNYMERFKLINGGIKVAGEQFSLNSYAVFWDHLDKEQFRRKNAGEKCLIARVTHSNDISLWAPNDGPQSYLQSKLLIRNSQRSFIMNGGIIVRILIGQEEVPNQAYATTIADMEKIGIEVKYISEKIYTMPDYDFLYLYDEDVVLKWFASPSKNLSAFEIQDNVEQEVRDIWSTLYYIFKDNNDPIKSIPEDREFF